MGLVMREALLDQRTVEVVLNTDGKVWVERMGEEFEHICDMTQINALTLFNSIAHSLGEVVNSQRPILEGKLIVNGARFEGVHPAHRGCAGVRLPKQGDKGFHPGGIRFLRLPHRNPAPRDPGRDQK